MKRINLTTLLCLACVFAVSAQAPTKKYVDNMVGMISTAIIENYVLPTKGEEIAAYFRKDHKAGRFYGMSNLKKLDSTMTKSLREVSNDWHLYTKQSKKIVAQLASQKEEAEEVAEAEDSETESTNFFNDEDAYASNFGFEKVEILPDNIGYIKLSQINISDHSLKKLYSVMALVEHTKALIIDLRGNGGGGSTVGPVLETFFLDKHVDLLEFHSRNGQPVTESTVSWLLESRYLKPLYLLINKGTGSAAEAFAFALKHQDRCIVVGQRSGGGANMNSYFAVNQDFIVSVSTAAPFLPGTTESWEGVGVQPHHEVEESKALDKAIEIIQSQ